MTKNFKNEEVEVLCIGTELLLGKILNSNAKWISEQLASIGLLHFRQTVVGDNSKRLKSVIIEASERSRVLITTGGLGPTPDDLTTETIARAFNTKLIESKESLREIDKRFKSSGLVTPPMYKKQALYPIGADILPNPTGTAPGIIWTPSSGFTVITFPGVPSEMKKMWVQTALPWLNKNVGTKETIQSKTLRFTGISESALAEKVNDLLTNQNPTVSPYASLGEVQLRITAKAKSLRQSSELIEPIEAELIKRAEINYFGSDEESLPSVIIKLLNQRNESLSIAESCTGGMLGSALTSISGSSNVFLGGVIAYNNEIKNKILDVSLSALKEHGAVSSNVVKAMAQGVRKKFGTDWGISISGIAGPTGGTPEKPVGLIEFGIAGNNITHSSQFNFSPHIERVGIQELSVMRSLDLLRLFLLAQR